MENSKKTKRESFPDILRVIAACAVVLLHTLTGDVDTVAINQYPSEKMIYLAVMDAITWCVPIFIMVSGYLFLNPERRLSFVQMLKKYCRRIVLALFLFGVPYAMLELISAEKNFRPAMLAQGIVMVLQGKSWAHMWYLYLILFLYLITPALKWTLARMPKGLLYVIMAILLIGSSFFVFINKLFDKMLLPMLPEESIYLFYYLCGYLFACNKTGEGKAEEYTKRTAVRLLFLLFAFAGMVLSRVAGDFSLQMAYNYPFTVLVSLLIFGLAKNSRLKLNEKTMLVWRELSTLSFTVYLVHPVFVNILYKVMNVSLMDFPMGVALLVFGAVILLLSAIVAWVLCKIPFLKKYVL